MNRLWKHTVICCCRLFASISLLLLFMFVYGNTLASADTTLDPVLTGTNIKDAGGPNMQFGLSGGANSADKAFDGDISTCYDAAWSHGAYTGIDLGVGNTATVTAIRFYPMANFASRMVGGWFEGSNSPNSNYVTLYSVDTQPDDNTWTTITITSSTSYRYLRYHGPEGGVCDIAEIEFHGVIHSNSSSLSAPTSLAASPGNLHVNLQWTAPSGTVDSYNIYRGTASGGETFLTNVSGDSSTFSDSNVHNGVTYYYEITAVSNGVESSFSNEASATPNEQLDPLLHGTNIKDAGGPWLGLGLCGYANGAEKAFDGDTSTFYDAAWIYGAYTGIDLGEGNTANVTAIKFYPRANIAIRMVGGWFEGSNSLDSNYNTLYNVTTQPDDNTWTTILMSPSSPYRYLRYHGPEGGVCNIAEIEFHGILHTNPPPTDLTADTGFDKVILNWTAPSGSVDGYNIYRSTSSGNEAFLAYSSGSTTSYVDPGLTYNTTYFYKVASVINGSVGAQSNEASATPTYTMDPLFTGTNISDGSGSQLGSSGTADKAFDSNLTTCYDAMEANNSYTGIDLGPNHTGTVTCIRYCPKAGFGSRMVGGVFEGSNSLSGNYTPLYTVADIPPDGVLTYIPIGGASEYRYLRYRGPNYSWCNVAEVEFHGISHVHETPVPTNLSAVGDPHKITLSWTAPSGSITGYNIYRSTASGQETFLAYSSGGSTTYVDNNATLGTTYYYQITTVLDDTESAKSNEASAVVNYTMDPLLTGTNINDGYGSHYGSGFTADKAFDGDLTTAYIAMEPCDSYTGIDLGTNHTGTVTSIRYCPAAGLEGDMIGGVFEGSNSRDSGYVPLYTVTTAPSSNVLTYVPINGASEYRYLRYRSPAFGWCIAAEIEFHGIAHSHDTPVPENLTAVGDPYKITLNWTAPAGYVDGYNIYRSTTSGAETLLAYSSGTSTTYVDNNVTIGTTYYYKVSTVYGDTESAKSNEASATASYTMDPLLTGSNINDGYGSHYGSAFTADKAFDGDLTTSYIAMQPCNSYTGIDLGPSHTGTVTSIRYCPAAGWEGYMIGGVFEGSNSRDSGYVPLYTVTAAPQSNFLTYIPITGSSEYRYLRYRCPAFGWCIVAEVEFHGILHEYVNTPPRILQTTADPNPVTGNNTNLSVVADDDGGEANLTYTWSVDDNGVIFQGATNGTNNAKNITAVFPHNGAYNFTITVTDEQGLTAQNQISVVVNNQPLLTSLTVSPSSVEGAAGATGIVAIDRVAPAGGTTISLSCTSTSDPAYTPPTLNAEGRIASAQNRGVNVTTNLNKVVRPQICLVQPVTVPISVVIPEGQTTSTFPITTSAVNTNTYATITATLNSDSISAGLTVTPPVLSFTIDPPKSVIGGSSISGALSLSSPAPNNYIVYIESSDPCAQVSDTQVVIPANTTVLPNAFTIDTMSVATDKIVTITCTPPNGISASDTVTVKAITLTLSLDRNTVDGGGSVNGTLTLSQPLSEDQTFVLSGTPSDPITFAPASVTIPAGQTTGSFTIAAVPVAADTTCTISAANNNLSATALLTITSVAINNIALTSPVYGGNPVTGVVTLSSPAPAGGLTINLSDNPSSTAIHLPATVTVQPNQTTASFTVPTDIVTSVVNTTVTAAFGASSQTTSLEVDPTTFTVSLSQASVPGGSGVQGTITLNTAAPSDMVFTLGSQNAAAVTDAAATVRAGQTTAVFNISTVPVLNDTTGAITVAYGGVTLLASLTVTAPGLTVSVSPPKSVYGGYPITANITLSSPAPNNYVVNLASSDPCAQVPASVIVPAGATTLTQAFVINTTMIGANKVVTVTGTPPNGKAAADTLTVKAITFTISLNPAAVFGGSNVQGTITLNTGAPVDMLFTLNSQNSAAYSDQSTVIKAGATSAVFNIYTAPVSVLTSGTIIASYGGVMQSAALTVNPPSCQIPTVAGLSVTNFTAKVTLTSPALAGGETVNITTDNAAAVVPASVIVPASQTFVTFPIGEQQGAPAGIAHITATLHNTSATVPVSFTGNPVVVPGSVATVMAPTGSQNTTNSGEGVEIISPSGAVVASTITNILNGWVISSYTSTGNLGKNNGVAFSVQVPAGTPCGVGYVVRARFTNPYTGLIAGYPASAVFDVVPSSTPALLTGSMNDQTYKTRYAYVCNYVSNDVSVIDTTTYKLANRIPVGKGPFGSVLSPDAKTLYVTNMGNSSGTDSTISVVDTTTDKVTATIKMAQNATKLTLSPDGTRLYAANFNNGPGVGDSVTVVNTANNSIIKTISGFPNSPYDVLVSPDNTRLYVASWHCNAPDYLSVVDTATYQIIGQVLLPACERLVMTPDGKKIYVGQMYGWGISVIDTQSFSVIGLLNISNTDLCTGSADGLAISPDGKKLFATGLQFFDDPWEDYVAVIDTTTDTMVGSIPYHGSQGISVTEDGKRLIVADNQDNVVNIFDMTNNYALLGTIPVENDPESVSTPYYPGKASIVYTRNDQGHKSAGGGAFTSAYTPFTLSSSQPSAVSSDMAGFDLTGIRGTLEAAQVTRAGHLDHPQVSHADLAFGIKSVAAGGAVSMGPNQGSVEYLTQNSEYNVSWMLPSTMLSDISASLGSYYHAMWTDTLSSICSGNTIIDTPQNNWPCQRNILTSLVFGTQALSPGRVTDITLPGGDAPLNGVWDIVFGGAVIASSGMPNGWNVEADHGVFNGVYITVPAGAYLARNYEVRVSGSTPRSGIFDVGFTSSTMTSPSLLPIAVSPSIVVGGNPVTVVVSLDSQAPIGGASVAVSADNPQLIGVPAAVVIPEGQIMAYFQASTAAVTSAASVHITAQYNGVRSASVTLVPQQHQTPGGPGGAGSITAGSVYPSGDGSGYVLQINSLSPPRLTATGGNATVTLNWNNVSGATGYDVWRARGAYGPWTMVFQNDPTNKYVDNNVNNGTPYYYVVFSTNLYGVSAYSSNVATATPMAPALPVPTFSQAGAVTITEAATEASIYYTTDGTDPDQTSNLYTGPFTVTHSAMLKARAYKTGFLPSPIAFYSVIVNNPTSNVILYCGTPINAALTATSQESPQMGANYAADFYNIIGTVGSRISITATANASQGGALIEPLLFLYDPNGIVVACSPLTSNPFAATLTYTLATSGNYLLEVTNCLPNTVSGGLGNYTVTMNCLSGMQAPKIALSTGGVNLPNGSNYNTISQLNFPNAIVGMPTMKAFTITNTGTAPLHITGISGYTPFTVAQSSSSPIAPGASSNFVIKYNPSYATSNQCWINVSSDDPVNPTFEVFVNASASGNNQTNNPKVPQGGSASFSSLYGYNNNLGVIWQINNQSGSAIATSSSSSGWSVSFTGSAFTVSAPSNAIVQTGYMAMYQSGSNTYFANFDVVAGNPQLVSLTFAPNPVGGGNTSVGTVTLDRNVLSDTTVNLSSGNTSVALPQATVKVLSGHSSANFTVTTSGVVSPVYVPITATCNGTLTGSLMVSTPYNIATPVIVGTPYGIYGDSMGNPILNNGKFNNQLYIDIYCATPGATIYYTLDGTDPATSSSRAQFTGEFCIYYTYTIRAVAVMSGLPNSLVTSMTYILNNPPSVQIAYPANNATVQAGSNVPIAVTGSDSDGSIVQVLVEAQRTDISYPSTIYIGSSSAAPCNITWSSIPAGPYKLTAIATDNDGGVTSTSVNFTATASAVTTPITCGQTIAGSLQTYDPAAVSLGTGNYADEYTFQAVANETVTITLSSSGFDTYLQLRDPTGRQVAANDNANNLTTDSQIIYTMPASLPGNGIYTIEVTSKAQYVTGPYTITVVCKPNTPNVQPTMALSTTNASDAVVSVPSGGTVDFGQTPAGVPLVKTFTIADSAVTDLAMTNLTLTGDYSLVGAFPSLVPGTKSVTFQLRFNAANNGVATGVLTIGNNSAINPYVVNLTGQGGVTTPGVASLVFNPASVTGGNSTQPTVTLTGPAPNGGQEVTLTTGGPGIVPVLPKVIVPAGQTTYTFTQPTNAVANTNLVQVNASIGSSTASAILTVTPSAAPVTTNVVSLTLNPDTVTGGSSSQATVTIDQNAPTGGFVVKLSSANSTIVPIQASVLVPASSNSATFNVPTTNVSGPCRVTLTAYVGTLPTPESVAQAKLTVNPNGTPPTVGITAPLDGSTVSVSGVQITAQAAATTPGATIAKVDFYAVATGGSPVLIGTAATGSNGYYTINWQNAVVGTYALTAVATDSNGVTACSNPPVNVTVSNITAAHAPIISPNGGTYSGDVRVTITDPDASTNPTLGYIFYTLDGSDPTPNSLRYTQPFFLSAQAGIQTVTARVFRSGQVQSNAATANFTVNKVIVASKPNVYITSPGDGSELSSPTMINGAIASPALAYWTLEYQSFGDSNWVTFASGSNTVGSFNADGSVKSFGNIAQFDPTMLPNGQYNIRLTAVDQAGQSVADQITVVVKGKLKVGLVHTSTTDMMVTIGDFPIKITRIYDSRNKSHGDFGVGWDLSYSNVKLQKPQISGYNWRSVNQGGLYAIYPVRPHIITVVLPNDDVYNFYETLNPYYQYYYPITGTYVIYKQMSGNKATLMPAGTDTFVYPGQISSSDDPYKDNNDTLELFADADLQQPYDPQEFILTLGDGRQLDIDKDGGLKSITDRNGNKTVFSASGIQSSKGTQISILRDSIGITSIKDPTGKSINYNRDANGNLTSVTLRSGNSITYKYDDLHNIISTDNTDGNQVSTNTYDANGRLIAVTDALGNITQYTYDLSGQHVTITDPIAHKLDLYYDNYGNITKKIRSHNGAPISSSFVFGDSNNPNKPTMITDAMGRTAYLVYDVNGKTTSVTVKHKTNPTSQSVNITATATYNNFGQLLTEIDPLGRTVRRNTYDSRGNLLSSIDAKGYKQSFTYNSDGSIASGTNKKGATTTYQRNTLGQVMSVTDPQGNVTSIEYDGDGNKTAQTKRRTNGLTGQIETLTTRFIYDDAEHLIKAITPDQSYSQIYYTSDGKIDHKIDPLGHTIYNSYDVFGRLTKISYPDGTNAQTSYDAAGRIASKSDRFGFVTKYIYDDLDRVIRMDMYGTGTSVLASTSYTYDNDGDVLTETDANGNKVSYNYDDLGKQISATDSSGNIISQTSYDAAGNTIQIKDESGNSANYNYDDNNNLTSTHYPDGTYDSSSFDELGLITSQTDQKGQTNQFIYDSLGRITSTISPMGNVSKFNYDEVNEKISQTDSNGNITRFIHDAKGHLVQKILPSGKSYTWTYNADGSLASSVDPNNNSIFLEYDLAGRLIAKHNGSQTGSILESYTYYQGMQIKSVARGSVTTSYTYDQLGHPQSCQVTNLNPGGIQSSISWTYDAVGNVLSQTTSSGTINYTYNSNREMTMMQLPDQSIVSYAYDIAGRETSKSLPDGTVVNFSYNSLGRMTDIITLDKILGTVKWSYHYTYDQCGRILSVTDNNGYSISYEYDPEGRLRKEINPAIGTIQYTYDNVGNRTAKIVNGVQLQTAQYDIDDRNTNFKYDENGNLLSDGQKVFAYDWENRLISSGIVAGDGTPSWNTSYVYDGEGRRIQINANSQITNYLWDPTIGFGQVIEKRDGASNLLARYDYGIGLVRTNLPNDSYYYHYDGMGNCRQMTNTSGQLINSYNYDAYGNIVNSLVNINNNNLYDGQQFDPSGLYYLRARYMDPVQGRFTSRDPDASGNYAPISNNTYAYADDDPVNMVDPSGFAGMPRWYIQGNTVHSNIGAFFTGRPAPIYGPRVFDATFYRIYACAYSQYRLPPSKWMTGYISPPFNRTRVDLADASPGNCKPIFEIKPVEDAIIGGLQVMSYMVALNNADPVNPWNIPNLPTWWYGQYSDFPNCPFIVNAGFGQIAIVIPPSNGLILYILEDPNSVFVAAMVAMLANIEYEEAAVGAAGMATEAGGLAEGSIETVEMTQTALAAASQVPSTLPAVTQSIAAMEGCGSGLTITSNGLMYTNIINEINEIGSVQELGTKGPLYMEEEQGAEKMDEAERDTMVLL